jgi:glutamate formiminotransferase/formiminotetrahydrofolate cyclodeaminase
MEQVAALATALGERVGRELGIPVYLYERAATSPQRQSLSAIRAGEYEGLAEKLADPAWAPDFGPAKMNPRSGATVIGARPFLVAYNVNLNTTSARRANAVAFDLREAGRVVRRDGLTGPILRDEQGEALREPGLLKGVKGIGWFIEEYGIAQVSLNLTDLGQTSLHEAFEATRERAAARGMRVTGSELVGMVPLEAMLSAGRYYLRKQERSLGISESEVVHIAIKSLGLEELGPFDPRERIIEWRLRAPDASRLVAMPLRDFVAAGAAETATPGGGSVGAAVGALGAAMATMVANLSANKRGWDDRWAFFSEWAERGQAHASRLLDLVDEDTLAFDELMAAYRMPKGSDREKELRRDAIERATQGATEVPMHAMREAVASMDVAAAMAEHGLPSSISDAGVGALCARAAARAAWLNVQINAPGLQDRAWAEARLAEGRALLAEADRREAEIVARVEAVIANEG